MRSNIQHAGSAYLVVNGVNSLQVLTLLFVHKGLLSTKPSLLSAGVPYTPALFFPYSLRSFPEARLSETGFPGISLLETVWKSERGRSMTYAPEHEKKLLNRSYRRRMEVPEAPCSGSQQAGTTENSHHPRDSKRHLLRPKERMSLAAVAPRLSALGDRLLVVQKMAPRRHLRAAQRHLRAAQRHPARGLAGPLGQEPAP